MHLKRHLLTVTAAGGLALAGLAAAVPTHVFAGTGGSVWCSDYVPNEMDFPILTGQFNLWLGVETGQPLQSPGHVALCWSQTSPGSTTPETTGGGMYFNVLDGRNGPYAVDTGAVSDPQASNQINYTAYAGNLNPVAVVNPGSTNGGQQVTFNIPFGVCSGTCYPSPSGGTINQTGAIVGTLSQLPPPPGGTSAAYQLNSLCTFVDGIQVACLGEPAVGATTGSLPPTYASNGGPCLNTLCLPVNNTTVEVGAAQEATIFIPGLPPIPVGTGAVCYRSSTSSPACPW